MGLMNLDQASLLRKLMNEKQRVKAQPFAILSTYDFKEIENTVFSFVEAFSKKTQRNTVLFGLKGESDKDIEKWVTGVVDESNILKKMTQRLTCVSGDLSFVSKSRDKKEDIEKLVSLIEECEQVNDTVFYYTGAGINEVTINLSMMVNDVLVFVNNTEKSVREFLNLVKVFEKMEVKNEIGIVMSVENEDEFKEVSNKIQELCWREFKYYIEPVGYYKKNGFDCEVKSNYLVKNSNDELFSENMKAFLL